MAPGSDSTSLVVSWTAPSGTVTSYDVQYQEYDEYTTWTDGPQDETSTTATITGLTENAAYRVQVRASNGNGDGDWSYTAGLGFTNASIKVSNSAETSATDLSLTHADYVSRYGTGFTLGPGTWQLAYVELEVKEWSDTGTVWIQLWSQAGAEPSVQIFSNMNKPPRGTGWQRFTASGPASANPSYVLTGGTTYYILILAYNATFNVGVTESDAEAGDSGWSIANTGVSRNDERVWSSTASTLRMRVRATPYTPVAVNNAPVFGSSSYDFAVEENSSAGTTVGTVAATDDDVGDTVTYVIGDGVDSDAFSMDESLGEISVNTDLNYEHRLFYSITVYATDGEVEHEARPSATVSITVTDVDEPPGKPDAPTVTGESTTTIRASWNEAPTGGPPLTSWQLQYKKSVDVDWTDYSGTLDFYGTFATIGTILEPLEPNTEYDVHVRGTNDEGVGPYSDAGSGSTLEQTQPEFGSSSYTRSIPENTVAETDVGDAITATDPNDDTLEYSLSGSDAVSFSVGPGTGQLQTASGVSYDHEANSYYYDLLLVASDGAESAIVNVTVQVTDVEEPPVAPDAPTVTGLTKTSIEASWSAPANDGKPAIESYDVQYKKASETIWTDGPQDQTGTSVTIGGLVVGAEYDVQVRATNDEGTSGWSGTGEGETLPASAPEFSAGSYTRTVPENSAGGVDVGAAITASDSDSANLTYSLGGVDHSSFDVGSGTGQIATKSVATYDHEEKATYTLTIIASDGSNTAEADVTVNVTDVDEPPAVPATPTVVAESTTSIAVTWTEPPNAGKPGITSYDLQYRKSGETDVTDGPQGEAGTSVMIEELDEGTTYFVQVRARNDEGVSEYSSEGEGKTADPPVYGLIAPSITVTVGDNSLRVAWTAPTDALATSTYDVSWILESADETPEEWSMLEDVVTGVREHNVYLPRNLTNDVAYDVRVRQKQGPLLLSHWSSTVQSTPTDQGSAGNPENLTKGTPLPGVLSSPTDVDVFTFSSTDTVCYVDSGTSDLSITTSPGTTSSYTSTVGASTRLVLDRPGSYEMTLSAAQKTEYEVLCRDTPLGRSRSSAFVIDRNYPSDVLWSRPNDRYFYKFKIYGDETVAIRTAGHLDTLLLLLDSAGNEITRSDDAWNLGNSTNAGIQPRHLTAGEYYVEIRFPYTTNAPREDSNIPLFVEFPTLGGGNAPVAATEFSIIGELAHETREIYTDTLDPTHADYGLLEIAGEADYWKLSVDGEQNVMIRATAEFGSKVRADVLDSSEQLLSDIYVRSSGLYGGRNSENNHVHAVTIAGHFDAGTYFVKIYSSDSSVTGKSYTLSAVGDPQMNTYDSWVDGGSGQCTADVPSDVQDKYFGCQWWLGTFASLSLNVPENVGGWS